MFTRVSLRLACRLRVWFLCLCALSFSLHALAAGTGAQGDWWMFHHDPQHTGRSAFSGPSVPLLKWEYATGRWNRSSPAIGADGTIYVGSDDDNLYALNPADGSLKWKYATGSLDLIPLRPSARTGRSTSDQMIITSMRSTRRTAR